MLYNLKRIWKTKKRNAQRCMISPISVSLWRRKEASLSSISHNQPFWIFTHFFLHKFWYFDHFSKFSDFLIHIWILHTQIILHSPDGPFWKFYCFRIIGYDSCNLVGCALLPSNTNNTNNTLNAKSSRKSKNFRNFQEIPPRPRTCVVPLLLVLRHKISHAS